VRLKLKPRWVICQLKRFFCQKEIFICQIKCKKLVCQKKRFVCQKKIFICQIEIIPKHSEEWE
jgi:hypothetical protein